MISKVSNSIAVLLEKNSVIEKSEIELYEYGFFVLLSNMFFFFVSIICGAIYRTTIESMVFYITFSLLRRYAGGIHATSEKICFVSTMISIITCNGLIKLLVFYEDEQIFLFVMAISAVLIAALSPLDSANKPLTVEEKKHYKKVTLGILFLIALIIIIMYLFNKPNILYSCGIAIVLESILLIIGKIKR